MAQTGYTPILIYASGTATNVPLAANLTSSASGAELALNYADGKLYYKDSGGTVQILATKAAAQNSISFGTTGLTPSTATQGAVTVAGTLITSNGGTGLSSWTAGDLPYYATGTALSKLGIGTNGQILTSSGTAPQWSTLSGVAVTTFSAGTTGFTPSSATSGAVTLAGTLATTNGGTGLTSFTANGVVYASSTSALATGSALTFDGSTLGVTRASAGTSASFSAGGQTLKIYGDSTSVAVGAGGALTYGTTATFYDPTNLTQVYTINGSEQMRLTSTGLGIGTSSPGAKLDVRVSGATTTLDGYNVSNGTATGIFKVTGATYSYRGVGSNVLWVGGDGNPMYVGTSTAQPLLFGTAAYEQMRLDSSGNLGIGTSSPAQKLHVVAAGGYNATFSENSANNVRLQFYVDANEAALVSGYNTTAKPMTFYTGGAKVATLDSSGNLGLGVTPSAWETSNSVRALQLNSGALSSWGTTYLWLGQNWYRNSSGNEIYSTTAAATKYQQYGGTHQWSIAGSGTAGNTISFTQAMTLDASGNLLVGTTTSPSGSNNMVVAGAIVSTRINPRVSSTTSTASITPDISAYDQYCVTAQAATLTINAPIGTPVDGNKLMFRILDNGGSQTLTWNATFTAIGVTLPTATTASKMTYVGCIYNSTNTRWDVVAVTTQA